MADQRPMVFAEMQIGEEYTDEYLLTPEMARDYAEGIEDANSWYLEQSPFGGAVANPLLIVAQHVRLLKTVYDASGNVHTRHESQFVNPARIGKKIRLSGKLVEKSIKRGREYVVVECCSVDEDGIEICRDRRTIIIRYAKRPY